MSKMYRVMVQCNDLCPDPEGYEPRISPSFPEPTEDSALAIERAQALRDSQHNTWPELIIER